MADDQPSNELAPREPTGKMKTAGGIAYDEASRDLVIKEVDGVPIPFASPRMLWRMKAVTHREKDAPDLFFLRQWFAERGEEPPRVEWHHDV